MKPPKGREWAPAFFFLVAVAYKVPWTAISSLLGQFRAQFQEPKVLLYLNIAYFLPSIPSLLIHSCIQDRLERSLGVPRAALIRFVLGLGGLALLCLCLPLVCGSLPLLLAATAAVGACYSIAFGTSYQLAARFPPACTVALTTGFVSCGLVVLLADVLLKRGPYYTPAGVAHMFQMMALQTCIGLLAAAALLKQHARRLAAAGPGGRLVSSRHCPDSDECHRSSSSGGGGRQLLGVPAARLGSRAVGGALGGGLGMRHAAGSAAPTFAAFEQQQQQEVTGGCAAPARSSSSSGGGSAVVAISVDGSSCGSGLPAVLLQSAGSGPPAAGGAAGGGHDQAASSAAASWDSAQPPPFIASSSGKSQLLSRAAWRLRRAAGRAAATAGPLLQLGLLIWPAWTGLLLSVGSSMLAFPFFTFTPHHGSLGEHLPQVLFYSRLLGDILGRVVPPALQLSSSSAVLAAGAVKAGLLALLLPALLEPRRVGGDVALALLVAVNWWLSGYVNTCAYLLAPRLVTAAIDGSSGGGSEKQGEGRRLGALLGDAPSSLRAKAGGLMAFCFQVSCFSGLMAAYAIQTLLLAHGWQLPAAAPADGG